MEDSERVAVAAHLHVVLRRKTGRVTDTEWMACNQAYAQAMAAFALEHAREQQDEELARLARRLQDSWSSDKPRHAAPSETAQSDGSVTAKPRYCAPRHAISAGCAETQAWPIAFSARQYRLRGPSRQQQ
jgi:hypothetical protein